MLRLCPLDFPWRGQILFEFRTMYPVLSWLIHAGPLICCSCSPVSRLSFTHTGPFDSDWFRVVITDSVAVDVMPAPRQTISLSKKNHDLWALRPEWGLRRSKVAAPYWPSDTPPTKAVVPFFTSSSQWGNVSTCTTVVPGKIGRASCRERVCQYV